jgi:hypothetical protein
LTQHNCISSIANEPSVEIYEADDVEISEEYDSSEYYDSDEDHYAIDSEISKFKNKFRYRCLNNSSAIKSSDNSS